MNSTLIVNGMKSLIEGLKTNTWPTFFFNDLVGLSKEASDSLPKYMFYYMVVYLISALTSLVLHFLKKQKSFSDLGRKFVDIICWAVAIMCFWLIPQFIAQGKRMAAEVEGSFSFTAEGVKWLSQYLQAWFDPIWLGILIIAIAIMPLLTIKKYIKKYKLAGIPWAIFDEGFALFCMSAAVLVMFSGNILWYTSIPGAFVLILLGQIGGADLD